MEVSGTGADTGKGALEALTSRPSMTTLRKFVKDTCQARVSKQNIAKDV